MNVKQRWKSTSRQRDRVVRQHRCYGGHDCKIDDSTPTQTSLLRPWIRYFTIIISAWCNLTSSKLKKSEAKLNRKTQKQRQLLRDSGFVLCIAPSSLSRDRTIKTLKSKSAVSGTLVSSDHKKLVQNRSVKMQTNNIESKVT